MKLFIAVCLCLLSAAPAHQAKYSNTKYGVSFEYPKGYQVKQGALDADKGLGYQDAPIPMQFAAPRGIRLVTVELPANSYPGTDFTNAYFTVSVNEHLSKQQCEKFSDDMQGTEKPSPEKISGIEFHSRELGDAGMGHQFSGTYYHGFSGDLCYELGYGLHTAGYGAVEGLKRVNQR